MAPKRGRPSRYKAVPPRKPVPLYPCAHCGIEFPRHQALQQAGYCDACEYLEWKDVLKELLCAAETPANLHKAGKLSVVYVGHYPLYQRCEVEQEKAHRRAKKTGWSHVLTLAA